MKICLIVNEYPPDRIAGTAVATKAIAACLNKKGIDTVIIVTERFPESPAATHKNGSVVYRLQYGRIPFLRWIVRIYRIRQIVGGIRPDVIHAQAISCGLYAKIASFGRHIPVLTSIQGRDLYESSPFQRRTEVRWSLKGADQLIALNRELVVLAENFTGVSDIRVIHYGFTPENVRPDRDTLRRKYAVKKNEFVIITVARLTKAKGLDILISSLRNMPKLKLWIIGEGEERKRLEKLIQNTGFIEQVHLLGLLNHYAVAERMKAADLFVMPSRSEPFGISILEAMDAGLPIVATRVGGIPEFVKKENGVLVPPGDPIALGKTIRCVYNDSALRRHMSRMNIEKSSQYHWDEICNRYIDLYVSLSEGKRRI